ncbi:NAD-dependent epimerase/dehydratase family protein [Candidatus Microgenomates bacterium]|nr:MAG: NAD-dependent epimerase/dehydratase family protein [Candidatus Microgenomates bacterium]
MKILVTGGAGFIASHIVDKYLELGHDVVIIDNLFTGQKKFINPKVKFYEVDIRDQEKIASIFTQEKPEVLNHHAAQMDVRKSVTDPVFDANVNIIGLINLMENGKKNGLKKVVFASSGGAVYGDAEKLPTPESYPTRPASPYGISKLTSEYYLDFYSQTYGVSYVALRYGNVYGPRQNPHGEAGVVAIFAQKMLKSEQPIINGDGEQSRDFVFVADVVDANVKALDVMEPLKINIGTGKNTTINTIFDNLVRLTGTSFQKQHATAKKGEQKISLLDYSLATQKLNWQPKYSISEGLAQTVEYFKHESN